MVQNPVSLLKDAPRLLLGLLRLADLLVVGLAGWAAYYVRSGGGADLPSLYSTAIVLAVVLTANFMQIAGCYRVEILQRLLVQVGRILGAWLSVIFCLTALSFFTGYAEAISQIWAALWFALSFGGLLLVRGVAMLQIRRWQDRGQLSVKVALVGTGPLAQQVARQLAALDRRDVVTVGHYDDKPALDATAHRSIADLLEAVQRGDVDEIVVALPWSEDVRIKSILKQLRTVSINVRICPDAFTFYLPLRGLTVLAGIPVLNVFARSLSGWKLVVKNLEDKILAPIIFLLFSPFFLAIALAVKLDSPGPVFFRQKRYGFNNNEITVLKFRSMRADTRDEAGTPQATRNDPRVTRVGRILRRSSLDELPQLLNVIRGDMSLVGPRPHAVDHNKKYAALIDEYLGRHRMKPGITGWAQVNGLRGETPNPELMRLRVQHDLYYIEHWSLWLDIRILLMTFFVGFVGKRAY